MKCILASNSPRRKELVSLLDIPFNVIVSECEETIDPNLTPLQTCIDLAYQKAYDVYNKTIGDRIIIGSDTIVVKDNKIYGKPKDYNDALNMLNELNNSNHKVISSLCVLININGKLKKYSTYDSATVYFDNISNENIIKWINTGKCYDKAGAYAIQEEFKIYIKKINGDYNSIVGLPINKLNKIIEKYKKYLK